MEQPAFKTDGISYYLVRSSTALKRCNQKKKINNKKIVTKCIRSLLNYHNEGKKSLKAFKERKKEKKIERKKERKTIK